MGASAVVEDIERNRERKMTKTTGEMVLFFRALAIRAKGGRYFLRNRDANGVEGSTLTTVNGNCLRKATGDALGKELSNR